MIRPVLGWLTAAFLVVSTYWNILSFDRAAAGLPPRNLESEGVIQETRYERIREILLAAGYRTGSIGFVTNRDLESQEHTNEDENRFALAQFVLVPWIILHGTRSVSGYEGRTPALFVIGDFWDGPPAELPPDLVKLYQTGDGLILFRRKHPE